MSDFPSVLSRAWVWGRRILWTAVAVFVAVLVLEAIHLHRLLEGIHPAIAWTVTGAIAAALLYAAGAATLRYLRTPRAIVPPELPAPGIGWTAEQQAAYRSFAIRYLRRQERNPHLLGAEGDIRDAIRSVEEWRDERTSGDPVARTRVLVDHVQREIDQVVAPLDAAAKRLIRRTAVEVSIATAVSPSILLDGLITLSRNLSMVSKLADLYYGRPGLPGTLRVTRDVIGSAVAAGALEIVSDNLASVASEVTGNWSSRLLGPVGQGAVNGVVTMRLGAAARVRCRSLTTRKVPWRPWRVSDYRRGIARLVDWLSEDVGPRFTRPLVRWIGGSGDADDTGDSNDGSPPRRPWWNRVFRAGEGGTGGREPAPAASGDPLLDGDLLD